MMDRVRGVSDNRRFPFGGPMNPHIYIAAMIVFTTYSQLIIRWKVGAAGVLPEDVGGKLTFIMHLLLSPWVLSAIAATFVAGVAWMLALSKFELSYAYPYTGLIYILVMGAAAVLFGDAITPGRVIGTLVTVAGLVIISRY